MNNFQEKFGISLEDYNYRYHVLKQSANSIGKSLGYKRGDYILEYAIKLGITRKDKERYLSDLAYSDTRRIHSIDKTFFKKESFEMGWVLGLMASDGNVVNTLKGFNIVMNDEDCLLQVSNLLKSDKKPVKKNDSENAFVLDLYSKEMVLSLLKLGITPNKSLVLEYPNISNKLDGSFFRGVFDGDGNFSAKKPKDSTGLKRGVASIYSGSFKFVNQIIAKLKENNIESTLFTRGRSLVTFPNGITSYRHETYIVRIFGINTIRFFEFIYKDSNEDTRLFRKYCQFEEWYKEFKPYYDEKLRKHLQKQVKLNKEVHL